MFRGVVTCNNPDCAVRWDDRARGFAAPPGMGWQIDGYKLPDFDDEEQATAAVLELSELFQCDHCSELRETCTRLGEHDFGPWGPDAVVVHDAACWAFEHRWRTCRHCGLSVEAQPAFDYIPARSCCPSLGVRSA